MDSKKSHRSDLLTSWTCKLMTCLWLFEKSDSGVVRRASSVAHFPLRINILLVHKWVFGAAGWGFLMMLSHQAWHENSRTGNPWLLDPNSQQGGRQLESGYRNIFSERCRISLSFLLFSRLCMKVKCLPSTSGWWFQLVCKHFVFCWCSSAAVRLTA